MPPASAPDRVALLRWRAVLAAAALSAALATALLLPGIVSCALWRDHGCRVDVGLKGGLGLAVLLWGLWLAAALTQPLLPRAGVPRRWGLAVQIGGLTLLFATLNGVLHTVGAPDGRLNAYTLQIL